MHTLRTEIEFDPDKAQSNLRKHRVAFAHAEQSLRDELAITVTDPDAEGESRFVTLGMDALGRVLVVVLIRPAFRRHPEAIIHGNHRGVYGQ